MMKSSISLALLLIFSSAPLLSQTKYEREHRIKRSQFPEQALQFIGDSLENVRRLRFYKETDSARISFEAKLKKDRLHYSIEFNKDGILEDIEILIKEVDIPRDAFSMMKSYLEKNFHRYRIRKIQQQYPVRPEEPKERTLKNAFQNLLLPYINYELIVGGKMDDGFRDYEILFDSEGNFINMRISVPANYDHVLY